MPLELLPSGEETAVQRTSNTDFSVQGFWIFPSPKLLLAVPSKHFVHCSTAFSSKAWLRDYWMME